MQQINSNVHSKHITGKHPEHDGITLYAPSAIEGMRQAGKLASEVLDYLAQYIVEGVTTEKIDQLAHAFIIENRAIPAPLNYHGFPKSICTSVNHVVCHGIPSHKVLMDGDILNIDVTVIVNGWYGDSSRMFGIGKVPIQSQKLIQCTEKAMMAGIRAAQPGNYLGDIGYAVQSVAHAAGFSVVQEYCGHGIGHVFHAAPNVLHYGQPGTGVRLMPGMFITVEPMINAGKADVRLHSDGWTVFTRDKKRSAQFEHTIAITEKGVQLMTVTSDHDVDVV